MHFVFLEYVTFIEIKVLPKPVRLAAASTISILRQRVERSYSLGKHETPGISWVKPTLHHLPVLHKYVRS